MRTGDHEQVGEAGHHDPEIGAWSTFPLCLYRQPCIGVDVDCLHRTGHRIKTGRKDDRIEHVFGIGGAQSGRRDFLDRPASDIDQGDVVAIVGFVIVGIEDEPLGADRMVVGAQQFGRLRILDRRVNLPANKLRCGVV